MLSARYYIILIAFFVLSATANAQSEFVVPPEGAVSPMENQATTPRAWGTPAPPPGFAPIPSTPPSQAAPNGDSPSPNYDDSYFVPVQPSRGFDQFRDEEDPYTGFGRSYSRKPREVKDSFKFVEPAQTAEKKCSKWRNELNGPKTFSSKNRCQFELERQVDNGMAEIASVVDQIELFKLKKVIRGEISSREEAKKYSIGFDSLANSLKSAAKKGCTCAD